MRAPFLACALLLTAPAAPSFADEAADARVIRVRALARAMYAASAAPEGRKKMVSCMEGVWTNAFVRARKLVLVCPRAGTQMLIEKAPGFKFDASGTTLVSYLDGKTVVDEEFQEARELANKGLMGGSAGAADSPLRGAAQAEQIAALSRHVAGALGTREGRAAQNRCHGSVAPELRVKGGKLEFFCVGSAGPGLLDLKTPDGFRVDADALVDSVGSATRVSPDVFERVIAHALSEAGRAAAATCDPNKAPNQCSGRVN